MVAGNLHLRFAAESPGGAKATEAVVDASVPSAALVATGVRLRQEIRRGNRPVPGSVTAGDTVYLEQSNQADNTDTLTELPHRSHRNVHVVHLSRTHAP